MANPVEQRPDGPDGRPSYGDVPDLVSAAEAAESAPRLPTRVPFSGPHPGTANPDWPQTDVPPRRQVAPRRKTPAAWHLRGAFVPREPGAAGDVPVADAALGGAGTARTEPDPSAVPHPDAPVTTGRNRKFRVRMLSGSAVAALLVAGSLWWWDTRVTIDPASATSPEGGTATMPVTAPVTGAASAGSDGASAGPVDPVAPSPTPSPRPANETPPPSSPPASPAPPKASVNTAGRNLALNGAVTASSVERSGWAAPNAVDGDPTTRWSSGFSDPQWLRVDLGARWQISEIRLTWENAHATTYRVELSTDGTTWKSVYSTTSGRGGDVVVEVAQFPARFVRVYGTKRSTDYGYSLLELDVR
ncbi:discoidin domain-containing protein [Micromonospora sp. NBC_01796]|uniref:discoidin domain-containing protein n=1 Tax=Micromonospora sp. NBC_01796 TaxID=2975987 RepID=UPI002DD89514|nr:discoidin domain-containing protein [Micromonospora sp. NBC_01796]WSA83057.1 discoidin domain-containing protein [Micromonospora sp. NBC_01796]